jgi:phage-related minor tail protein
MKRIALAVAIFVMAAGACRRAEQRDTTADSLRADSARMADSMRMSDTTHRMGDTTKMGTDTSKARSDTTRRRTRRP